MTINEMNDLIERCGQVEEMMTSAIAKLTVYRDHVRAMASDIRNHREQLLQGWLSTSFVEDGMDHAFVEEFQPTSEDQREMDQQRFDELLTSVQQSIHDILGDEVTP